ncbi:hypothetical protein [Actinokineospora globicatena]|uniref:Mce-associated membrane protein n=1 Tax=Actinokineospora globicatena TaxID=103729 RepID=A0A9W6QPM1_9PSEU|nr:hypothetical protein [Actinokineospora globicatena]GLW94651.1 hypothetical protein Aglo03_54670 [Actinokineospora globicatena]
MTADTEPHPPQRPAPWPSAPQVGFRVPAVVVYALVLLVIATLGVALWFGVAWARAGADDDLALAGTRDEVSRVASSALVTVSTLDYRKVDEDLNRWEGASTGPLLDEFKTRRASSKGTLEQAKTVTTATVLKIAVTDLREREGKAEVIAAVRVDVTPEGKQATPKYLRLQAALDRTADGWKLSGVTPVPFTPAG